MPDLPGASVAARPVRPRVEALTLIAVAVNLASAIFEIGLRVFIDLLGVSVSVLSSLAVLVLFVVRLASGRQRFRLDPRLRDLLLPLLGYWCISLAGIFYSPAMMKASFAVAQALFYLLVFFADYALLQDCPLETLLSLFRMVGRISFLVLLGFSVAIVVRLLVDPLSVERLSVFDDYNIFVLSLYLSTLLMLIRNDNLKVRFLAFGILAAVLIAGMGIIAGSRRTAVLYLPLFFFSVVLPHRRRVAAVLLTGLLALAIVAVPSFLAPTRSGQVPVLLEKRIARGLGFVTGKNSAIETRTDRWKYALEILGERPAQGLLVGFGTRSFYADYRFIRIDGSEDHPHNALLSALLEGGSVKVVLLVVFIVSWALSISRLRTPGVRILHGTSFLLWVTTSMISGEEFFFSKQIFMLVMCLMLFSLKEWESSAEGCESAAVARVALS